MRRSRGVLLVFLLLLVFAGTLHAGEAKLTVWAPWSHDNAFVQALVSVGRDFTAETGIGVVVEPQSNYDDKLQVALVANAIPDLIIMRGQFVDDFHTLLLPLSKGAFTPEDCLKLKSVQLFAYRDNRYYFWPYPNFSAALTLVNTEVMQKTGLDPALPEEIHELAPMLRKIVATDSAGTVTRHGLEVGTGLSAGAWLNNLIVGAGGQWAIDGKATLDAAPAIAVAEFLLEQAG
jgi:ABC-type glycerol-3-phosphate transport system substrate-binding protein